MKAKVFGIGFHKTGTTSLRVALETLGYRVTGPNGVNDPKIAERGEELALHLVQRYDAFQDNPWPIVYQSMDRRIPGSKFILTLRPTDEWIRSVVKHFGTESTPMREWIYGAGSPVGHEGLYVRRYEQHNREVQEYFKNRPMDLLVLRIAEGGGWDQLCPFLGIPRRATPFPHENPGELREFRPNSRMRTRALLRKVLQRKD